MLLGDKDPSCEVYYDRVSMSGSDPVGLVVRTETDGDELLPCVRVRAVEFNVVDATGKSDSPVVWRKTDSVRHQNTEAVKAIMAAFGYKGPITPSLRKQCLAMLAHERAIQGL